MKKFMLPNDGTFYKANLHAHTTVSDGGYTAAELKERYKANGYSILAITDHELLVDHSHLSEPDFLMLTGMEYAVCEYEKPSKQRKTIEFNFFAKDPHNTKQVCYDPSYVIHGEKWRAPLVEYVGEPFKREYTIESLQTVIDAANANGFLVSLNHPVYSMETPEFFGKLHGLFAMEIYNHMSFIGDGVFEYNPAMYENMLRRGHNLYCIAADDCHFDCEDDYHRCDRYGGFVMIKAPELTYASVIRAMEKGDFYASQGPLIEALYVENDTVHLHCSPAKYVAMNAEHRLPFFGVEIADKGGYLTEVTFPLPKDQAYIRFDVIDEYGRHANTRAYDPADFIDETH